MNKLKRLIREIIFRIGNYSFFKSDFLRKLPTEYQSAAKLLFFRCLTSEEKRLAKTIESFRKTIPTIVTGEKVFAYDSPHSGDFNKTNDGHAKVGNLSELNIESHIKIGTARFKGILLKRIVDNAGSKRILELGTNTGFSGCYFLSNPNIELVTIEGSEGLSKIADQNIKRISSKYRIMNNLFDEAIDILINEKAQFDCFYIDGQHEREATLYYAERLIPLMAKNAIIIFDDIYWSDDMNMAWKELCINNKYSEAVDLALFGVCKIKENPTDRTQIFDIGDYLPRPKIYLKNW